MLITAPILFSTVSQFGRSVQIHRVVPGNDKHKLLITQFIAEVKFNAKFTGVKIKNKSNFFFKQAELNKINKYIECCFEAKKMIEIV